MLLLPSSLARWQAATICAIASVWLFPTFGQSAAGASDIVSGRVPALLRQAREEAAGRDEASIQFERTKAEVKGLGDQAVPAIREALRVADGRAQHGLVVALGSLNTNPDEVAGLLLEVLAGASDASARGEALWLLEPRVVRRPLSESEVRALANGIETRPTRRAGMYARVSAKCVGMTPQQRREVTRAVVSRLVKEVEIAPPSDAPRSLPTYVSEEVYQLNQYALALRNLKDPSAVEFLQEHLRSAGDNVRLRKWLVIALGFSGYAPVGPELKAMLENDPDVSTRAEALRAYAAAVGPAAIPVLEAYNNDTTAGPSRALMDRYPLAIVARDELVDLRKMAK